MKNKIAAGMLLLLSAWTQAATDVDDLANQTWIKVESANFRIVTEQPEHIGRAMINDLENLRFLSNHVRGAESLPGPPLTILAMGKRNLRKLKLPETINGVFSISRTGYAALAGVGGYEAASDAGTAARSTLLHEYHHFLLHLSPETAAYPRWYDEGMAEYWSSLTISGDKASFGRPLLDTGREYWLVDKRGNANFDTRKLFNTHALKRDGSRDAEEDSARFYAQSLYAIHYFNSKPELRQQLARYLRLHNDGVSQDRAVQLAFGKDYAALDKDMAGYIERKLVGLGVRLGKDGLNLPRAQIRVTRLDLAGTYAVLADMLPHFRFGPESGTVARDMVAASLARNPHDPNAHVLALMHGPASEQGARFRDLLARYPDNPRVLALSAESLRAEALGLRDTGAADWRPVLEESRKLYRRAIALDPDNAFNFYGLGSLYALLPDGEALDEGIVCLDTAVIFSRDAATFRELANLYMRNKQLPQALKSIRSAVAFGGADALPYDVLLMESLELATGFANASPTASGLVFEGGARYEGPLRDGKPEGGGKWSRPNGSYYEGTFANGLPAGRGKLVSERGLVYEGEFTAGVPRGQGRITFPAGGDLLWYQGRVDHALPSGTGVLMTADGGMEGNFVRGVPHGSGVFTPARKPTPVKAEWRFGRVDWPVAGDTLFTGGIDADGERDGSGWCRTTGAQAMIAQCVYRGGKRVDASARHDDI